MDLTPYVESIRRDLLASADVAGEEARAVAERLLVALDSSVRLTLIDVLGAVAELVTAEIAPGSVELRLRGREPEFVFSWVPEMDPVAPFTPPMPPAPPTPPDLDDGSTARISLRLPDGLKARIEEAANDLGSSVNAWLVRALNDAVTDVNTAVTDVNSAIGSHRGRDRRDGRPGRHLSGWVR